MKIRATATKGTLRKGEVYDLPEGEARAAIRAGIAVPLAAKPEEREKAVLSRQEKR